MPTRILPHGVPLRGLNTVDPTVSFDSGYARELTNYAIVNGHLEARPAVREQYVNAAYGNMCWMDINTGSTSYGIEAASAQIYNLSTGATGADLGSQHAHTTTCKHVSLTLLFGVQAPRITTNPFTAWTFTTLSPGITATAIVAGCSHKGRLYVTDGTTIEYSSIGQITGAMFGSFPVSSFMDGQLILRMFSVTAQPGNSAENTFVIFGDGGKVLVYEGEYPGSSSWRLIGNYNMTKPFNRLNFVEIDGDVFVAGVGYAYWFRDLFLEGAQSAYENRITKDIDNLWQTSLGSFDSVGLPEVSHCYYLGKVGDVVYDAIVVSNSNLGENTWCPYPNEQGSLVYFKQYKAWAFWHSMAFFHPVIYDEATYFGSSYSSGRIVKLSSTHMVDEDTVSGSYDIQTSWKTPFAYPFSGRNQKSVGIRPLLYNNVSGYLHRCQAIYDFSDYNSLFGFYTMEGVTSIPPGNASGFSKADQAANSYGFYQPFIGIGGSGGGVSFQITQKPKTASSETQRQGIYALTAYIEDGGDMI